MLRAPLISLRRATIRFSLLGSSLFETTGGREREGPQVCLKEGKVTEERANECNFLLNKPRTQQPGGETSACPDLPRHPPHVPAIVSVGFCVFKQKQKQKKLQDEDDVRCL